MSDITCPACGKAARLKDRPAEASIRFECPFCHTWFSITFDNGVDGARRAYELAKDTDDQELLI